MTLVAEVIASAFASGCKGTRDAKTEIASAVSDSRGQAIVSRPRGCCRCPGATLNAPELRTRNSPTASTKRRRAEKWRSRPSALGRWPTPRSPSSPKEQPRLKQSDRESTRPRACGHWQITPVGVAPARRPLRSRRPVEGSIGRVIRPSRRNRRRRCRLTRSVAVPIGRTWRPRGEGVALSAGDGAHFR